MSKSEAKLLFRGLVVFKGTQGVSSLLLCHMRYCVPIVSATRLGQRPLHVHRHSRASDTTLGLEPPRLDTSGDRVAVMIEQALL